MRFYLLRLLWVLNLPILLLILPQAILVKRKTLRLPPASGTREQALSHPLNQNQIPIRILHMGESTVDGVGVAHTREGFTAQIAQQLQQQLQRNIHYTIRGQNGLRLQTLVEQLPENPNNWNLAIITMGVNDCKGLTPLKHWRSQIEACIDYLRQQQDGPIFFTQVPPMEQFPALPFPLKNLLGLRCALLNLVLEQICHKHHNVNLLHAELNIERQMMAEDGFHPSQQGYDNWARQITPSIVRVMNNPSK